ncbi:YciI family protein [Kribbella sp. NPDC051952]|uniref:YciI family protein n=1 Tax=Kribbella sp. NPDC051952 TaxID=3154851 RepID=UPI0034468647
MSRYLISFGNGSMDHIPEEDFPAVVEASHAVIQEAKDAGAYVVGGGLIYDGNDVEHAVVGTDGTITDAPYADSKGLLGGATIVNVPTRDEALKWAAKIAVACRCAQDVRKFGEDPEA